MIFYKTHPARKTRKLTQESILPCSPWHQSSPHCAPVSQKWICRLEDGGKTEGRFFCVLFSTKEPSPCVLSLCFKGTVPLCFVPLCFPPVLRRQGVLLPAHGQVIGAICSYCFSIIKNRVPVLFKPALCFLLFVPAYVTKGPSLGHTKKLVPLLLHWLKIRTPSNRFLPWYPLLMYLAGNRFSAEFSAPITLSHIVLRNKIVH